MMKDLKRARKINQYIYVRQAADYRGSLEVSVESAAQLFSSHLYAGPEHTYAPTPLTG